MRPHRLPLVALSLLASCAEAPVGVPPVPGTRLDVESSARFLGCPSDSAAVSTVGTIGVGGGALRVGPLRLEVPANAVLAPTTFELVVPPSPYLEVQLHAVGVEHFVFERPVLVTLDLGRCGTTTGPGGAPLQAVYVAPVTREVLEVMGGRVDAEARKLRFETGHFSSYVVAY